MNCLEQTYSPAVGVIVGKELILPALNYASFVSGLLRSTKIEAEMKFISRTSCIMNVVNADVLLQMRYLLSRNAFKTV